MHSQVHSHTDSMTLPACFIIHSKVHCHNDQQCTSTTLRTISPITFSCTLPELPSRILEISVNSILLALLTVHSPEHSQDALKHTLNNTPKYTLMIQDTSNLTGLYTHMNGPGCLTQQLVQLAAPETSRWEIKGWRQEAGWVWWLNSGHWQIL